MRVFVAVLALFALACQQTPRYRLENRAGETWRIDTRTGEMARLQSGAWVPVGMGTPTPTPNSTGLPNEDLVKIGVRAEQVGDYRIHVTVDNNTRWHLTDLQLRVASGSTDAPVSDDSPLAPGKRISFMTEIPEYNPSPVGTGRSASVLSAEGHLRP